MKFIGDTTGLDELYKDYRDTFLERFKQRGIKAVHVAHDNHGSFGLKAYKNHTWHLRTAPGCCIVEGGETIWTYVHPDADAEARSKTEAYLIHLAPSKGDGIYLADGMEYASFVSAKGYDVLDSAERYLVHQLKKKK